MMAGRCQFWCVWCRPRHRCHLKKLDEENGQDKIKYFKADGGSGTSADYAYALLYWTLKVYYPIDGSAMSHRRCFKRNTTRGRDTYRGGQGLVNRHTLNGQAGKHEFTKSFGTNGSGQPTMTITPPSPLKRNYQSLTCVSRKIRVYGCSHQIKWLLLGSVIARLQASGNQVTVVISHLEMMMNLVSRKNLIKIHHPS